MFHYLAILSFTKYVHCLAILRVSICSVTYISTIQIDQLLQVLKLGVSGSQLDLFATFEGPFVEGAQFGFGVFGVDGSLDTMLNATVTILAGQLPVCVRLRATPLPSLLLLPPLPLPSLLLLPPLLCVCVHWVTLIILGYVCHRYIPLFPLSASRCRTLYLTLDTPAGAATGELSVGAHHGTFPLDNQVSLRLLVDRSIVEGFVNNGTACVTTRVYPGSAIAQGAYLVNSGATAVRLRDFEGFVMEDATPPSIEQLLAHARAHQFMVLG